MKVQVTLLDSVKVQVRFVITGDGRIALLRLDRDQDHLVFQGIVLQHLKEVLVGIFQEDKLGENLLVRAAPKSFQIGLHFIFMEKRVRFVFHRQDFPYLEFSVNEFLKLVEALIPGGAPQAEAGAKEDETDPPEAEAEVS